MISGRNNRAQNAYGAFGGPFANLDDNISQELALWLKNVPTLNMSAEANAIARSQTVETLCGVLNMLASTVHHRLADTSITPGLARQWVSHLGHLVASAERHAQGMGADAGSIVRSVPHLEDVLVRLGIIAQCQPRDTTYSLFLAPETPTFTGQDDERFNAMVVRKTDTHLTAAVNLVRPLREVRESLLAPHAAEILRAASAEVASLLPHYRAYRQRMGEFFFLEWRQYLVPFPVGGKPYLAPNPAHVSGWPRLDLALGHFDGDFERVVLDRASAMLPHEMPQVLAEFALRPLSEVFLDEYGLTSTIVQAQHDREALRAWMVTATPPTLWPALTAYAALLEAAKSLTAAHWSLIVNFIVRPSQKSQAPDTHNTRASSAGVSGRPLAETKHLMDMRRNHPVTELLAVVAKASVSVS